VTVASKKDEQPDDARARDLVGPTALKQLSALLE
jgi:hypothetical protein